MQHGQHANECVFYWYSLMISLLKLNNGLQVTSIHVPVTSIHVVVNDHNKRVSCKPF